MPHKIPKEQVQHILKRAAELRTQGVTWTGIAERLGVNKGFFNKHGIFGKKREKK